MKVAYLFATQGHTVSYVLAKMILPQLEANRHGVDVVGMFFSKTIIMCWSRETRLVSDCTPWPKERTFS